MVSMVSKLLLSMTPPAKPWPTLVFVDARDCLS
jgi:hypothetical protein